MLYYLKHFNNPLSIASHYADNKKCLTTIAKSRLRIVSLLKKI